MTQCLRKLKQEIVLWKDKVMQNGILNTREERERVESRREREEEREKGGKGEIREKNWRRKFQ